jgi:Tol biopolymer transport system component
VFVGLALFMGTSWGGKAQPDGEFIWEQGPSVLHRQLTGSGEARSPSLSPDGSLIAFWESGEVIIRPVHGEGRIIVEGGRDGPVWTPDGLQLLFLGGSPRDGTGGIYSVPATGGTPRWISPGFHEIASAPDNSRLLTTSVNFPGLAVSASLLDASVTDTISLPESLSRVGAVAWDPYGDRVFVTGYTEDWWRTTGDAADGVEWVPCVLS